MTPAELASRIESVKTLLLTELHALREAYAKLDKELESTKQRCALEHRRHDDLPDSPRPVRWHSSD